MDAERWRSITAIFDAALAAPAAARDALLSELCAGDAELRAAVDRLLHDDAGAGEFLSDGGAAAAEAREATAGPPPTWIGRYEVAERIGRGGFGDVFRAHDPSLKRTVAIKTCLLDDADVRRRFALEAEIAAPLDHPHITRVYDVGSDGGVPFLVQEFLTGEDLQAVIARRAPIPLTTRLRWLAEAARGLAHAHARGVVHRDIKPGNLRVVSETKEGASGARSRSGVDGSGTISAGRVASGAPAAPEAPALSDIGWGTLKILDFGIARHVAASTVLTQAGAVLGTLAYMAPERMRGGATDHRADIYALGAVAYELCTYRRPFAGDSAPAVLYAALHSGPTPLLEVWPECPRRLARLIAACLERDPARRPQSAEAVAAELEAIAAGIDDSWVPAVGTADRPLAPLGRRARTRWLAAAAGVAGLATAAWLGQRLLVPAPPPEPSALRGDAALSGSAPGPGSSDAAANSAGDVAGGLLMIDALPWGEVTAVRDRNGDLEELPAERTTPLAIALPPDFYTVTVRGPDLATERTCSVRLPAAAAVACTARFAVRDAAEFVARVGS